MKMSPKDNTARLQSMSPIDESDANEPADSTPKAKPEPSRRRGGAGSGLPPTFKVGVDLEDWGSRKALPPITNAFGIDFGQHITRVACLRNGIPFLVPPRIVESAIKLDRDSHSKPTQDLRTLLLDETSRSAAETLVREFFDRVSAYGEPRLSLIEHQGELFATPDAKPPDRSDRKALTEAVIDSVPIGFVDS